MSVISDLRDLQERLRHIAVMHGVDGADIDLIDIVIERLMHTGGRQVVLDADLADGSVRLEPETCESCGSFEDMRYDADDKSFYCTECGHAHVVALVTGHAFVGSSYGCDHPLDHANADGEATEKTSEVCGLPEGVHRR